MNSAVTIHWFQWPIPQRSFHRSNTPTGCRVHRPGFTPGETPTINTCTFI